MNYLSIFSHTGVSTINCSLSNSPSSATQRVYEVLLKVTTNSGVQNRSDHYKHCVQCTVQHSSPAGYAAPVLLPQPDRHGGSCRECKEDRQFHNQCCSTVEPVGTARTAQDNKSGEEKEEEEKGDTEHCYQDNNLEGSGVFHLALHVPGLVEVGQVLYS